jgi:hypothetical protein
MKFLVPLALVLLFAACASTPVDTEAARQARLEKEARANFYVMREQLSSRPIPPPTPTPAPAASRGLFAFVDTRGGGPNSQTAPPPTFPERTKPPRPPKAPPKDDTVYYWQVPPPRPLAGAPQFTKAELRYARELAKNPENLTPEERLWAREHY